MRKLVGCSLVIGMFAFSALGATPKPGATPVVVPSQSAKAFTLVNALVPADRIVTDGGMPGDVPMVVHSVTGGAATAGPTAKVYSAPGDTGTAYFWNWMPAGAAILDNQTFDAAQFQPGDTVVGYDLKVFRSTGDPNCADATRRADVFVELIDGDPFGDIDSVGGGYSELPIAGTQCLFPQLPCGVHVLSCSFPKVVVPNQRVWMKVTVNSCRLGWRLSLGGVAIGSAAPVDGFLSYEDNTSVGNCCNGVQGACDVAGGTPCTGDLTGGRGYCHDGTGDERYLYSFGPSTPSVMNANVYAPAQGLFHMQPVACVGNTCSQVSKDRIAASKPGGRVIFDIMLSDWSTSDGVCDIPAGVPCQRDSGCDEINGGLCTGGPERLQTWQATLNSAYTPYPAGDGFGGPCDGIDLAGLPVPGFIAPHFNFDVAGDLRYTATLNCTNNAQCSGAFGTGATCSNSAAIACNFGANGVNDPACDLQNYAGFDSTCLNTNVCTRVCKPGFQNTNRADWVHHDIATVAAVDSGSCNYRYGSTMGDPAAQQGPFTDPTKPKVYGGSLVLDMSANARGTATVGFDTSGFNSFMISQAGPNIPLIGFENGFVEVTVGSCCYNLGPGTSQCSDDLLENECNAHATTNVTIWSAGAVCAGDGDGDGDDDSCPSCTANADCIGFDNDGCTADTCVNFLCVATALVCDDDNVCTTDTCDTAGAESTTPKTPGTMNASCVFTDNSVACDDDVFCNGADTCVAGGCDVHAGDPCTDGLGCTGEHCDETANACVDDADVVCDDGNPCSYDTCTEPTGACNYQDINLVACATAGLNDPACLFGADQYECNGTTCVCVLCPDLEVTVTGDGCYDAGEKFVVKVNKTAGPAAGAQLAITYDPNCVQFVSISPGTACGGTAFGSELYEQVNQSTGSIFYAVGVALGQGNGTSDADVLACISFTRKNTCANCEVCVVEGVNPNDTRLTDDTGQDPCLVGRCEGTQAGCVATNNTCPDQACIFNHCEFTGEICDSANGFPCPAEPCVNGLVLPKCSGLISLNRTVTLTVPDDDKVNSDCDHNTAIVNWDAPSATVSCGDGAIVTCDGSHESGYIYPTNVVLNGGELAQGVNTFCCEARGNGKCAGTANDCWTVEVTDQTTLDVVVQLSPLLATKPTGVTRCIEFEAWTDCVQAPIVFCRSLVFGGLFDLTGHFTDTLKMPKGQFACLTARDKSHTLRSCVLAECADGVFSAVYKGDPFFGGNWLIGGNLDAWKKGNPKASHDVIDILDFGSFISQYLKPAPQDTPCPSTGCHDITGTHADINGDGYVDIADFTFISMNFLESSKDCCCPGAGAATAAPLASVSVEELRAWDMADLTTADLNRDGFVDMDDMATFMQGGGPIPKAAPTGVKGSSVRPEAGGSR